MDEDKSNKCWLFCKSIIRKGAIIKLDTGVYFNGRRKFVPTWAIIVSYLVMTIVLIQALLKFNSFGRILNVNEQKLSKDSDYLK